MRWCCSMTESVRALPWAHGGPPAHGRLRSAPEDFRVWEIPSFEPDGEGEHLLLRVRKRDANTHWVAGQLARFAGVPNGDSSYAGMKDRFAVTEQWFSLRLAGRPEPDWAAFELEGVEILERVRHRRKLKRGALRGNRFRLVIRELEGERSQLEDRLRTLAAQGVPNYFGEQRFGREDDNVARARQLFAGQGPRVDRHKRGLYLSAARSHLFNQVLARRVEAGTWNRILPGDVMMLDGRRACFTAEPGDPALPGRLEGLEVHPTGPLWGRGQSMASDEAQALEAAVGAAEPEICAGLERAGMDQERRALRLVPAELSWEFPASDLLELEFSLPAGAYATVVLRELLGDATAP